MLQIDQDTLAKQGEKRREGGKGKRKTRQEAAEKRILVEGIWINEQRGRRRMGSGLIDCFDRLFWPTFKKKRVQMGTSKRLINKDIRGEQSPEGESVAKTNRWKQVMFEALVIWFTDRNADTGKSSGQQSGQVWFYGSLKYCLQI